MHDISLLTFWKNNAGNSLRLNNLHHIALFYKIKSFQFIFVCERIMF